MIRSAHSISVRERIPIPASARIAAGLPITDTKPRATR
jgi:hypothetical protein